MQVAIRKIQPEDNESIRSVIRQVFEEHGINKPGTAYFDSSLNDMYTTYTGSNKVYYVALLNGKVVGGAGVYPTEGLPDGTCELIKMYLLPEVRGLHIGKELMYNCIDFANDYGYRQMYLETLPELDKALKMYEDFGFKKIDYSLGNTGHYACDIRMLKKL